MRILFTVQGEGRGHLTQALAVHQILSRWGHDLVGVVAGSNSNRSLPEFFAKAFPVLVVQLQSPGFAFRGRSVALGATLWRAFANIGTFRRATVQLRALVAETRSDLVVNFFEPLTGLLQRIDPLSVPVVSIAHQFMLRHPAYPEAPGFGIKRVGLELFIDLVGFRSWKLALSLSPAADLPEKRLLVGPPLLRRELFDHEPKPGRYYLIYVLNCGYAEEIRAWHRSHPDVAIHCFYDRPGAPDEEEVEPNLTFHRLSGEKFLRFMTGCRAVACTAGFESVAEAAWLGKPVFLVPVEHHVEQMLNGLDAARLGFGISAPTFDLDRLTELPERLDNEAYREWVRTAPAALERIIRHAIADSSSAAGSSRLQPVGSDRDLLRSAPLHPGQDRAQDRQNDGDA